MRVSPGGDFTFKPGQYATLGVVTPQKHIERAYSIVSAPHEPTVEFFMELVPKFRHRSMDAKLVSVCGLGAGCLLRRE